MPTLPMSTIIGEGTRIAIIMNGRFIKIFKIHSLTVRLTLFVTVWFTIISIYRGRSIIVVVLSDIT